MRTPRLGLLTLFALAGCEELPIDNPLANDEAGFALDAVEAVELTALEAALVAAVVEGIPLSDEDTAAMASFAADAAPTTFTPDGCVTALASQSTVTYTFDGCDGPLGLSGLDGVATASFSVPASESVTVSLTASDLGTEGATSTINTTGTYANDAMGETLALTTTGAGQTDTGDLLTRVGAYTVSLDGDCLDLDGQWNTTVNDETFWTTVVEGYRVCAGQCPESGKIGHAAVDSPQEIADPFDGSGIVVTIEGGATAAFLSSEGVPGVLALECP